MFPVSTEAVSTLLPCRFVVG